MAKSLKDLRLVVAKPPRERGVARMWRAYDLVFEKHDPGYVRDTEIALMHLRLGEITRLVNETVADDEKACLLMETIGYTLGDMFRLGSADGAWEPENRLRDKARAARKGSETRGKQMKAKAAEWHEQVEAVWQKKQGQFTAGTSARRRWSNRRLAMHIVTDYADVIPGLPKSADTVLVWIKKLNAEQRAHSK